MSINVKTLYNNLGHRLNIIKLLKSSFFFHFFIVYIYIYILGLQLTIICIID